MISEESFNLNFLSSILISVLSASFATVIHDAISNPTEVIKQRLQMYNSPYKSIFECARKVFKNEGFSAFYRSYTTQLVMNLPYQAIHFSTYEFFQEIVSSHSKKTTHCWKFLTNMFLSNSSSTKSDSILQNRT